MKILVTGACGLLGHRACTSLCHDHDVWAIDNHFRSSKFPNMTNFKKIDLTDLDSLLDNLPRDFDYIMHYGAINGTSYFYEMPTRVMTNNLLADLNIFEFAKKNDNLRLLVYASSSEVVADQSDGPVTETNTVHVENIHNARWSYRLPKICAENYLSNSDLASLIIRYFNVYGADSLPGHFVADQINQIKNHRFDLIGGNETRCFCHVNDAIEATIKLMLGDIKDIVNIGNDQPLIIREAANIIAEFFGSFNVQWNELPGRSGSIKTRVPDLKKLYSYMPEYQPMNFKTGMNLIVQELS